jgi:type II secretory pathway pseudopilin PulG
MVFDRQLLGASKLEFVTIVALIGIVAVVLLSRLFYYEEQAEKAQMEYTATALKNALRVQMSLLLIQGRTQEYAALAQQNPLDWLEPQDVTEKGAGSHGKPTLAGSWNFDPASHTLVYAVKHGNHFVPDSGGQKRVRWRVDLIRDLPGSTNGPVIGLALVLIEPYRWFA